MTRWLSRLTVLILITAVPVIAQEKPPWQRLLQGEDAQKVEALEKQKNELAEAGKYAEAIKKAEKILALRRRGQGQDHWEVADALRQVEDLKQEAAMPPVNQRRLAEAREFLSRGEVFHEKLKYAEAEAVYRQALAIREQVLGPRHPKTAETCHALAVNLNVQSKYSEAGLLFQRYLDIWKEAAGLRHPNTGTGYGDLAGNLSEQGKLFEAEPLIRKALALREEVLGPLHSETGVCLNNLALNLNEQGRYAEAEPLHRQGLNISIQTQGPSHPQTAISYVNLASTLREQGKCAEAEPLFRKGLSIFQQMPGPPNPNTGQSFSHLAANLDDQGKFAEAEILHRKALEIFQQALEPGSPEMAQAYNNLALNLNGQAQYSEAEPLFRKAVTIVEQALKQEHPFTAVCLNNLAFNLNSQGKYTDAELIFRQVLAIRRKVSPRHPDLAVSYHNLAANLGFQGKNTQAEAPCRQAMTLFLEVLGPQHPSSAACCTTLALILGAQGKYAEAEPFWLKAVAAFEGTRLRWAVTGFDRAQAGTRLQPHFGLAACLARLGKPAEAWQSAEAGLGRGLLDDLTRHSSTALKGPEQRRLENRVARLEQLDRLLLPLLTAETLDNSQRARRDELAGERAGLLGEIGHEAAEAARREVRPLEAIQKFLPADGALILWIDPASKAQAGHGEGGHWASVVRRTGPPAWVQLKGSGENQAWTKEDGTLPRRLRTALSMPVPGWQDLAQRLVSQRLGPLQTYLEARDGLPAVTRLFAVPVGSMAGLPLEVLTDRFVISYIPSGTMQARLAQRHRPLREPSLLALGDPVFPKSTSTLLELPSHGLLVNLVLPNSPAAGAGLRNDDVLLRYGDKDLKTLTDFQERTEGEPVRLQVWREGKVLTLTVPSGKLDILLHQEPALVVQGKRRQLETLLASSRGPNPKPLPASRNEVKALETLVFPGRAKILLGSEASEPKLEELAAAGQLKNFRLLHFATHGEVDFSSPARSALLLAADHLPDPLARTREGKKVYTGRLEVKTLAGWQLDADLVTLSACQTALGKEAGGEGLLGFTQVLFAAGARALVLSLWKVDDVPTALLMARFYENLLGKRSGLKAPLGRAAALQEAKTWLRDLRQEQVKVLAANLTSGVWRGTVEEVRPLAKPLPDPKADRPYAHPFYWSAFILIGDPD